MNDKIKNPRTNFYTITDFATITGKTRNGIYYIIKNDFEVNKDYKILSDNKTIIVINDKTKRLILPEHKKNLSIIKTIE